MRKRAKSWWAELGLFWKTILGILLPTIAFFTLLYKGTMVVDARYAKKDEVVMLSQQTQQNSVQIRLNYLYTRKDQLIRDCGFDCEGCPQADKDLFARIKREIKYLENQMMGNP